MNLTFDIPGAKDFLKELEDDGVVQAGVSVEGPAAAYAEVWEWGNTRQTKKGPRTVLGINPDGERVWLSSQAPYGYIWTNENKYWEIVRKELGKLSLDGPTKKEVTEEISRGLEKIAEQVAQVISETAPVDTGQLSESFRVVKSDDPFLKDADEGGTLENRFRKI